MTLPETIRSQLHLDRIRIDGHNGTFYLTPEQARKVLAGGELVVDALGVRVR